MFGNSIPFRYPERLENAETSSSEIKISAEPRYTRLPNT